VAVGDPVRGAPAWGHAGTLPVGQLPRSLGKDFLEALRIVARWEGGDSDHPSDPGGRTRWGITHRTWAAWLRSKGEPQRDLATMNPEDAAQIYRERYWEYGRCPELPFPASLGQFDAMVQHGPGGRGLRGAVGAMQLLQRALGVEDDGIIGPRTRAALQESDAGLAEHLLWERAMHYWRILDNRPQLRVFSNGWRNRVVHLREQVLMFMPARVTMPPIRLRPVAGPDPRPLPLPEDARKQLRRVA
jgi:lysozyme family protein